MIPIWEIVELIDWFNCFLRRTNFAKMTQQPRSLFSPVSGLVPVSSVSASLNSPVPSTLGVGLMMKEIWDDPLITQYGDKGWMCGYCGKHWNYINTSRVIRHLIPTYPAGTGIASCVQPLIKFSPNMEKAWEEYAETTTHLYHRRRNKNDTASLALNDRTTRIADAIALSGKSKRLKRSDDDTMALSLIPI